MKKHITTKTTKRLGLILVLALVAGAPAACATAGERAGASPDKSGTVEKKGPKDPSRDKGADKGDKTDKGQTDGGKTDRGNTDQGGNTGTTSTTEPGTGGEEPSAEVQEFTDELIAVAELNEQYWAETIVDEYGDSAYTPPSDIITYVGSSGDLPYCGDQQLTPQNAFYCPADNTLVLDVEYVYENYLEVGDMFLYVLMAHEYGHSAQFNLEPPSEYEIELQADCFAGAHLQWELDNGLVELEEGDESEANQTLAWISSEYGSTDNHGTLAQRSAAFEHGRDTDAEACTYTADYISWS